MTCLWCWTSEKLRPVWLTLLIFVLGRCARIKLSFDRTKKKFWSLGLGLLRTSNLLIDCSYQKGSALWLRNFHIAKSLVQHEERCMFHVVHQGLGSKGNMWDEFQWTGGQNLQHLKNHPPIVPSDPHGRNITLQASQASRSEWSSGTSMLEGVEGWFKWLETLETPFVEWCFVWCKNVLNGGYKVEIKSWEVQFRVSAWCFPGDTSATRKFQLLSAHSDVVHTSAIWKVQSSKPHQFFQTYQLCLFNQWNCWHPQSWPITIPWHL